MKKSKLTKGHLFDWANEANISFGGILTKEELIESIKNGMEDCSGPEIPIIFLSKYLWLTMRAFKRIDFTDSELEQACCTGHLGIKDISWHGKRDCYIDPRVPKSILDLRTKLKKIEKQIKKGGKMKCPHCMSNVHMNKKIVERVQIDVCPLCLGIWLDKGELKKIKERSSQDGKKGFSIKLIDGLCG